MKAYEIHEFGIDKLARIEREKPQLKKTDVLVKFHSVSLNYRDLMMIKGWYNPKLKTPIVPLSDGAGEVIEIGEDVSKWKVGDRVMPSFMQSWQDGGVSVEKARSALGGDLDGVLRELGAFDETGLVEIPDHLTYSEAATLPCAAVTAWNALKVSGDLQTDETVLLLGTGGVSIFALQFANAMGADVIITSSSNEKLSQAESLGANHLLNYKEEANWDENVIALTENKGVDHIVEVGGAGTLKKSLNSVRMGGHIAIIGVLASKGEFDPISILMKAVRLQGIFVGSRKMFEQMNGFISEHYIKPIVDKEFPFEDAKDALKYMESGAHFGKVVIKI